MEGPRAVVIPFGVPSEGRGLGLGLAALLHGHAHFEGSLVALAQLHGRRKDDADAAPFAPVEAFVPPHQWQELGGGRDAPESVSVVITGAFEPPGIHAGHLHVLAFDSKDGSTRAAVEAPVDEAGAGAAIVRALREVSARLGADVALLADLDGVDWTVLESVLRAERCALHDADKRGPHDRLAALIHLGRAVSDAPQAKWPAARLALFALDAALSPTGGGPLADAAVRALSRAVEDAPEQLDLSESLSIVCSRLGRHEEAERHARVVVGRDPKRARAYGVLSEVCRARKDHQGALAIVTAGIEAVGGDPLLVVERGIVLAERGELDSAGRLWRTVLVDHPLHAAAYANLAQLCVHRRDGVLGLELVDSALAAAAPTTEVLRHAIDVALAVEPEGLPRAARLRALSEALVARSPGDAWARLTLAQALAQAGERSRATEELRTIERQAPTSPLAAEAQRGRFALEHSTTAVEVEAVLRAALTLDATHLDAVAARARRLALVHDVWPAHFALGVAERRRGRGAEARTAFERVLSLAPGCVPARHELEQLAATEAAAPRGGMGALARALRWLRGGG